MASGCAAAHDSEPPISRFSELPLAARAVWAKSADDSGYGLLAHMLDVAAVAERILEREPPATRVWAARSFHRQLASIERWLAWLVGQHDVGKATVGFQAKWERGRLLDEDAGLAFPSRLLAADRHDLSSAALLAGRLPYSLAGAVAAHHGFHFEPVDVKRARQVGEPPAWNDARLALLDAYDRTLSEPGEHCVETLELDLGAINWLAGLTSVADWIGSNVDWFPLGERDDTFVGHHARALDLADRALDAIGWPNHQQLLLVEGTVSTDDLIARVTGMAGIHARPLQAEADALLLECEAPALLIVEAPMGEGKTELAFLAHLRLQARLGHRGMYVGLPTQATGNAMFDRALRFLKAFPGDHPLDLQLAHGAAALDERLIQLRGIHGAHGGASEAVQCSSWFGQRRRALLSPYGVGTVDQVLYATLNVKHHFVRLWGLGNKVVVLDEIHAYDSYTGGLIEALLRWLKALGCSVVLMSATLPQKRRLSLLRAWEREIHAVPELPYPRVLIASAGRLTGRHFASRPQSPIQVCGIDEGLDEIAAATLQQLLHGGCVAVIVNTVERAQQLYRRLRPQLSADEPVLLFHARFPAEARSMRERQVLHLFGKDGERPRRALLIATQVAEQSLDIDFDVLISDLAPVDLLLQRAGRLHRHDRSRPPGHGEPRLIVAGLLATGVPDLKRTGWASVYDSYLLGRTWAFALQEQCWSMPADIDRLVQRVYGDEALPEFIDSASREFIECDAYGEHCAEEQQMVRFAANAAIDADAAPQDAYAGKPHGRDAGEGLGAENRTRLGTDSVSLVPVHVDGGEWRLHPDEPPFDPGIKPDIALAHRLLNRQVKLSRKSVVKAMQGVEVPKGWAEHPWLRDMRPLQLISGCWYSGALTVQLDPELGVVYSSAPMKETP